VLFQDGRLRHLPLQDLFALLVHVALHAGEGVVAHLAQVGPQALLLRVICRDQRELSLAFQNKSMKTVIKQKGKLHFIALYCPNVVKLKVVIGLNSD